MSDVPSTADIQLIQQCIPHRYPFLLVDRVEDIRANEFAKGVKMVTMNEPHFQGHFPGTSDYAGCDDHRSDGTNIGGHGFAFTGARWLWCRGLFHGH